MKGGEARTVCVGAQGERGLATVCLQQAQRVGIELIEIHRPAGGAVHDAGVEDFTVGQVN